MGKLVHKLPSITLSRLSFCTLGPIFQKKWPNWNSRVCVFIQAPKFCPSFYTLEISKCVHSCLKQSSIMWTIKSKHCVPGGVCCVKLGEGKYGGVLRPWQGPAPQAVSLGFNSQVSRRSRRSRRGKLAGARSAVLHQSLAGHLAAAATA